MRAPRFPSWWGEGFPRTPPRSRHSASISWSLNYRREESVSAAARRAADKTDVNNRRVFAGGVTQNIHHKMSFTCNDAVTHNRWLILLSAIMLHSSISSTAVGKNSIIPVALTCSLHKFWQDAASLWPTTLPSRQYSRQTLSCTVVKVRRSSGTSQNPPHTPPSSTLW